MDAAGKAPRPLHGVPYGVKDLFATKGVRTTWGAADFENRVFDIDAEVVVRLRNAGAVLLFSPRSDTRVDYAQVLRVEEPAPHADDRFGSVLMGFDSSARATESREYTVPTGVPMISAI